MIRESSAFISGLSTCVLVCWLGACGSVPSESPTVELDLPERREILATPAPAAPPATDIFLLEVDPEAVPWSILGTHRVTDRDSYDNQPYFETDGDGLLFVSMRSGQTDIFRYRHDARAFEELTDTPESEYSPTPIPGLPFFSAVRVEADQTQRLWRFPSARGEGRGAELVFEDVAPVGYHGWIDAETVAMFVLGEPNRLVLGTVSSQDVRDISIGVGRAIHGVPGKAAVSFVDKTDPEHWWITLLDLVTGTKRRLSETPAGSEDFIWWTPRELLIGSGSKLYSLDLDGGQYWREVVDLGEFGIEDITRLSRSPTSNRLAVVGARRARQSGSP